MILRFGRRRRGLNDQPSRERHSTTWCIMAVMLGMISDQMLSSFSNGRLSSTSTTQFFVRHVSSWVVQPAVLSGRRSYNTKSFPQSYSHESSSYPTVLKKGFRDTCMASSPSSSNHIHEHRHKALSSDDEMFLSQAVEFARYGKGHTFPNPAVGCVIVRSDTNEVLGSGFHPRAGYPHAEIFALLEAAGHISSGVEAAKSVVDRKSDPIVEQLTQQYVTATQCDDDNNNNNHQDGPSSLFKGCFDQLKTLQSSTDPNLITAYVTLEPCCHYGRTPPCAQTLALAGVDRVVVGYRDPNPRVDGGGVKALQDIGVVVDMAAEDSSSVTASAVALSCADLVGNFVKRIIPKVDYDATDYSHVTGAMRRALRSYAGRKKSDGTMSEVNWTNKSNASNEDEVSELILEAEWMERLDDELWKEEVVNLRLNKAVGKKKLANLLGHRIAKELNAHVAQSVGHTVLIYRPGIPPVLDLEQMSQAGDEDDRSEQ